MLSATYTIADVKAKLENDYLFYGYTTDLMFSRALQSISEDVMMTYFFPKIGITDYNTIATKNKSSLTELELYLYWAEIYTVCVEFLKSRTAKEGQLQMNSSEMLAVEGYRYQAGSGSGSAPGHNSLKYYFDKMFGYWKLAGFNILSLERTCTIFGDSSIHTCDDTATTVPNAPVLLQVFEYYDSGMYAVIMWSESYNAAYYKLYRAVGSIDGTYSVVSPNDSSLTGTFFNDFTVDGGEGGHTYYYKLKAFNPSGESAYSNCLSVFIQDLA